MPQEVLNIIISAVSTVVLGLIGWGVTVLTNWLNTKIKDKKVAEFATNIMNIIMNAVKMIYQEFVEVLKKEGRFDEKAQKEAKEKAMAIIKGQLTEELKSYISDNYGDVEKYISNQIEVILYNLKNNK